MNKYSPKIDDLRARVLDTETLLHFMRDRENLQNMLDHGCPADPIRAMLDSAYNSISEANEFCIALQEASDEDFQAELKLSAREARAHLVQSGQAKPAGEVVPDEQRVAEIRHFDQMDEIHAQTDALLAMLLLYMNQAHQGGDTFNEHLLADYVWQLQSNNQRV
jgi:hypothetical protein